MDKDMKINEKGIWENETAEGHVHDEGLAKALGKFFQDNNFYDHKLSLVVGDIGCGDGYYTNYLTDKVNGVVCIGFDGNPNTKELAGGLCSTMDFTSPQNDLSVFDWILCLEVGEHIPPEYEKIFLNNLHEHNIQGIVLSWAIRGQGGDGHVNCLDNWEICAKILPMGYKLDEDATAMLRHSCAEYPKDGWWFRNTLMVFRRLKDGPVSS